MSQKQKVFQLTVEGKSKLEQELEFLTTEKRKQIIVALQEARAQGDLSENADYDAARDAQAQNEVRISEIENILKHSVIISESFDKDSVSLGRKVTFVFLENGKEVGNAHTYTIVGSVEANPFEGFISNEAPIAVAMEGGKVGDKFKFQAPKGEKEILIKAVE